MTEPTPPDPGPALVAPVLRALGLPEDLPDTAPADPRLLDVIDAVDAVNALCAGRLSADPVTGEWAPNHRYGARLLAARLYRRKDSPAGVLPFGQFGEGAAYVQRNDPDVAQLLGLGAYAKPAVG
jgi:hypothetical protein